MTHQVDIPKVDIFSTKILWHNDEASFLRHSLLYYNNTTPGEHHDMIYDGQHDSSVLNSAHYTQVIGD